MTPEGPGQPEAPGGPERITHVSADVRYTVADGLRGWQEARDRRMPLYGAGSIEVQGSTLTLRGWKRNWLGMATRAELLLPFDRLLNVVRDGRLLHFECRIGRKWRPVEVTAESEAQAASIAALLPTVRTPGFDSDWADLRLFNQQLAAADRVAWVTAVLVLLNLAVFVVLLVRSGSLVPSFGELSLLGANSGLFTTAGQWWRLLTATFLHASIMHFALNMWVLVSIGQLTERLYGNWTYLAIYLVSGVLASLASMVWNPFVTSVGASGSISGVLGAFLAYVTSGGTRVPRSVARAHMTSVGVFVAYSLLTGVMSEAVDNAAHVGGLLSGAALGWLLARPLQGDGAETIPMPRVVGACVLVVVLGYLGYDASRMRERPAYGFIEFVQAHRWFQVGEAESVAEWDGLSAALERGEISTEAFTRAMKQRVLPFWQSAQRRLAEERHDVQGPGPNFHEVALEYTTTRRDWAQALSDLEGEPEKDALAESLRQRSLSTRAAARLDYAKSREVLDHGPPGLRVSLRTGWHTWRAKRGFECVESKQGFSHPLGENDARGDGPALRHAAACEAQRKFMTADYAALDADLRRASMDLADLPDGGSTLAASLDGLSTMFSNTPIEAAEVLARISRWRRIAPDSPYPDIVEAILYQDWAWSARGHGSANQVSAIDHAVFQYRTLLAAAALREANEAARTNPAWYPTAIGVGVDASDPLPDIRAVFEQGVQRYPDYLPLYRAMLRALMPRWLGSDTEVAEFIEQVSWNAPNPDALYARLYAEYAKLENDNTDYTADGLMDWVRVQSGFQALLQQSPDSDYLLNAYAHLACQKGDAETYARLKADVARRPSATAWAVSASAEKCARKFDLAEEQAVAVDFTDTSPPKDERLLYQTEHADEAARAQVRAALAAAEPVRTALERYVQQHGQMPPDDVVRSSKEFAAPFTTGVDVEVGYGSTITMKLRGGPLDGHQFSWYPSYWTGKLEWECAEETVPAKYLQPPCRT